MLKSATLIGSVFGMGILLGLSLATLGRSATSTESNALPGAPTQATSAPEQQSISTPTTNTEPAASEALQAKIAHLTQQLDASVTAWQQVQEELGLVKGTLHDLEQRLDELTEAEPRREPRPSPAVSARQSDVETLTAAGFEPDEAQYLTNRWGQQQMDLLYLRDQAIREGWINTPRFEQAELELRSGSDSLREELGPEGYDQFLFASGRSNRVVFNSVIDSSPAQTIGLQPGDTVVSYDGQRIFSARDLRSATTNGEPGASVVIEIDRNGQRLELEIERGPIGVTLGRDRREP